MLRFLTGVMVAVTLGLAANLYRVSYQTRAAVIEVKALEGELKEVARGIETLKAERAYLARPDAIATMAVRLGMRPATGTQFRVVTTGTTGLDPTVAGGAE